DGTVTSAGPEVAVNVLDFDLAVASVEIHLAFKVVDGNPAVAGTQANSPGARHVNVDLDPALADIEHEVAMREAHFDFHRVSVLALDDPDAAFANLPALGGHVGFNLVLVLGVEANVGVGGVHAQLGGVFDVVGLGPVVSLGGGQQQSDGE